MTGKGVDAPPQPRVSGSPKGSSAPLQRPCHPELLLSPLPSPSRLAQISCSPSCSCPTPGPRLWCLQSLHHVGSQSAQNWPQPHFLHSGPGAGHHQDPPLPGSTAGDRLARAPQRVCSGDTPFSGVSCDPQGAVCVEAQPFSPLLRLSCLPTPIESFRPALPGVRSGLCPLLAGMTWAKALTAWLLFPPVKWWLWPGRGGGAGRDSQLGPAGVSFSVKPTFLAYPCPTPSPQGLAM